MADKGSRKPKRQMSELALASRRANLAKARAAPREKIYRPTEKRQAASRANLAKAIAARKSPEGNASARLNALRHGLYARKVAASVKRLGESSLEFRQHHALFYNLFAPQDALERKWVERLANTSWKRLRFLRALAQWETDRLKETLESVPPSIFLSADQTLERAYILSRALAAFAERLGPLGRFHSRIDRLIRKLLHNRGGTTSKFESLNPLRGLTSWAEPVIDGVIDDVLDEKYGLPRRRRSR